MTKTGVIRFMIGEDNLVVRVGLRSMLERQPEMAVVSEAATGQEAVELYRKHRPDIVLMDLRMPRMNGVEATIAIRAEFPHARIVVLTTYHGDESIYQALRAGARAYLLKEIPRDEFLHAVRSVHAGEYC